MSDREYQLTERWSAKVVDEVVKEVEKCSDLFVRSCRKTYVQKSLRKSAHFCKDLILQICMDLQDSVQRYLQNPADLHRFAKIKNLGNAPCLHFKQQTNVFQPKNYRSFILKTRIEAVTSITEL